MTSPRSIAMSAGERVLETVRDQQSAIETAQRSQALQPQRVTANVAATYTNASGASAYLGTAGPQVTVTIPDDSSLMAVYVQAECWQQLTTSTLEVYVVDDSNPMTGSLMRAWVWNSTFASTWEQVATYPTAATASFTWSTWKTGSEVIIGAGTYPAGTTKTFGLRCAAAKTNTQMRNMSLSIRVF